MTTAPAFAAGEVSSRPRLVLALVCVAQFVVVLDVTIVNVALPTIRIDLGIADGTAPWVISAYAVVFAAALLTGGRAADVIGRRESFTVGLLVFTLCSLVAGFAWNGPTLIAREQLQGFGAALLSPAAFSMLVATFPEGLGRDRALGVWASVAGIAAIAGVAGGGLITEALSWRWIFLVNVPLGAVTLALAPVLLTRSEMRAQRRLDLPTLALATVGLGATVLLVSSIGHGDSASLTVSRPRWPSARSWRCRCASGGRTTGSFQPCCSAIDPLSEPTLPASSTADSCSRASSCSRSRCRSAWDTRQPRPGSASSRRVPPASWAPASSHARRDGSGIVVC